MRTIGELSELTGIPVRKIKYYSNSYKKEDGSLRSDSAGLISPCEKRGKTYYYDDNALFELLMIQMFRSTDVCIEDIRRVLSGGFDSMQSVFESQIEKLENRKKEIERQIKLASLFSKVFGDDESGDAESEELFNVLMSDYMQDYFARLSTFSAVSFEKLPEIEVGAGSPGADKVQKIFEGMMEDGVDPNKIPEMFSAYREEIGFDSEQLDDAFENN